MVKTDTKVKKGFTIIEVVLVLAVAGLIFLMVFVALPAMQRGQRDTQRRNDMGRFISQLSFYRTDHSGKLPGTGKTGNEAVTAYENFRGDYLTSNGGTFSDPSSDNVYEIAAVIDATSAANEANNGEGIRLETTGADAVDYGDIYIYRNAYCDGAFVKYVNGVGRIAVLTRLESGGQYCAQN